MSREVVKCYPAARPPVWGLTQDSNVAARTNKTTRSKRVDTVRASRDGHQFHEAWVARRALGLLLPRLDLYGIAVEGLSEEDQEGAPAAAVEIADATFYYGNGKSFESCARMEVAQFKYSIGKAGTRYASRPRKRPRGYAGFVWEHRLALSYAMEMFNPARRFWDDLGLISISEPMDERGISVPPVFAMWNSLKADYAAARWLALRATEEMDETANYQDTLDYANYGVNQSVAVLAQRAAIDVLDKIAGFASEYLGLQGDAHRVYFASRWHTPSKQKNGAWEWQPGVAAEISAGNPGVLALGDLASDVAGDGYLSSHRLLRHTGTHRFVVLHDMLPHTPRPSPFIEHHRQFDFERTTVKTLQMCRAALTYAREMVLWRERRSSADGKLGAPMYAPPHHEIRGLKSRMRKR
jgi:LA2681-like HEPN